MSYAVIWTPAALQLLAAVWQAAADRNAVAVAAHAVDLILELSPGTTGVVVFDTVREFTRPPLGIEFEVDDAARQVFVLAVWDTARGRPAPTGN
ncbi:MAG: hypothetical protein C0501_15720 [Isosphaera sp.]|nr:hypothetical protein [Isosphaera sp.]